MPLFTENELKLKSLDALAYAKAWNEENKAGGWRLPEDPDYYAEYASAYDYEKAMAASALSDAAKEKNGFRPRGIYPIEEMTLSEIEAETARIYREEEEREEEEKRREAEILASSGPLTYNPFAVVLAGFQVS